MVAERRFSCVTVSCDSHGASDKTTKDRLARQDDRGPTHEAGPLERVQRRLTPREVLFTPPSESDGVGVNFLVTNRGLFTLGWIGQPSLPKGFGFCKPEGPHTLPEDPPPRRTSLSLPFREVPSPEDAANDSGCSVWLGAGEGGGAKVKPVDNETERRGKGRGGVFNPLG